MNSEHESHCDNCFSTKQCKKEKLLRKGRPDDLNNGCTIISCRLSCSAEFHQCKSEEHDLLCPKIVVPCINVEYGCPMRMERRSQATHLTTCPASVVVCTVEWNRKPLPPWQTQPFTFQQGHLDVAAVLVDQRTVAEFKENLPTSLKSLLKTDNKKQPIMPLGVSGHRIPNSILIQSKREKDALEGVSESDEEDFSFSETPGGSKKSPPGLQESVCSKLQELSLAPGPEFRNPSPDSALNGNTKSEEMSRSIISEEINSSGSLLDCSSNLSSKSDDPLEPVAEAADSRDQPRKLDAGLSLIVDVTAKGACKYMNLYTFMCAREFRRDEYPVHFKSIHNEILTQLNGWLFTRCPLANYGCSFGTERMFTAMSSNNSDEYHVVYNSDVGSFCFTQKPSLIPGHPEIPVSGQMTTNLCDLPYELLLLLTKYLDPLSLNALSMTNTLFRSICQLVVVERGIVVFDWERNLETAKWEVAGKKWIFSTAFSPLRNWRFADVGVVANHMKTCQHFNELRHRPEHPFSYPVTEGQL